MVCNDYQCYNGEDTTPDSWQLRYWCSSQMTLGRCLRKLRGPRQWIPRTPNIIAVRGTRCMAAECELKFEHLRYHRYTRPPVCHALSQIMNKMNHRNAVHELCTTQIQLRQGHVLYLGVCAFMSIYSTVSRNTMYRYVLTRDCTQSLK